MNSSATSNRRGKGVIRCLAWMLLYAAFAIAAIGANPFRDQTTGPFDLLAAHKGWNPDGGRVDVRHGARSDVVDYVLPEWMESRRQVREGVFPWWNPLAGGGHGAIFNPIYSELTPAFLLFVATPDPALGFYLAVLSSLLIAGLGMHFLVARYRSNGAAVFAGISYMLCGFITAWLFWPHTYSAIWIPWLLLCIDRFVRDDSRRGFIGAAICTALMFLGGFPFVVALGLGAAFVFAVVCSAMRGRSFVVPKTGGAMLSIVLGLALCAIPLLTLQATISDSELGYRHGGTSYRLGTHLKFLLGPWIDDAAQVESSMYVGVLVLAFATLGFLSLLKRKADALTWTGLFLLVVGVVLTFGLLPREIGEHLPVLSFNPWSRAILLLDIALILLSTAGFDWLLANKSRPTWALVATATLACSIQSADLLRQFRKFNGPTRSDYFYHVSPALAFLKERVKPFQYVAQDSPHYMISGTLNAVGLGDWFAHGLRSPQLRALLQSLAETPFKTNTATMVGIENYKWQADIADVAAMCYAIYPSAKQNSPVLANAGSGERTPLKPINNATVQQTLVVKDTLRISAIGVKLATYRATGLDGQVTATLRDRIDGKPLASATIPGAAVNDNVVAAFRFPDVIEVPPGAYLLELRYVPGAKNKNLTVWTLKNIHSDLKRDGGPVAGTMDYTLYGPSGIFPVVLLDKGGVSVAQNPDCADGAFWLDDLDDPKGSRQEGGLRLVHYEPSDFTIDVASARTGYVLVPMRYQSGWQATVNGRSVPFELVDGLLPAVQVPSGKARIQMTYRPPYWPIGLAISAFALVLLAWFGWRDKKSQP